MDEARERKLAALADRGDPETAWCLRGMLDGIERMLDHDGKGPLWTADALREGMEEAGIYADHYSRGYGAATFVIAGNATGSLVLALREIGWAWEESPNDVSRRLMAAIVRGAGLAK